MRKRQLIIAAAAAAAVIAGTGAVTAVADPSGNSTNGSGPDDKLLTERLDALAEVSNTSVVAEIRDGDEVWTQARGTRVDGGDEDAEPTDRVRIASLTKSTVATVVLQLVDEGKLKLDDSIQDLAPGLLPYKDTITIRQLLGHTTGVPDYLVDIYPSLGKGAPEDIEKNRLVEYTPEELVETATKRPLGFKPGTDYAYSNTNYYIIGLLVEKLTENTIEDEVEERVLEPADMEDTELPETDPTIDGDHLNAYFETGQVPGESRIDTSALSPTHFWAAGVAISNPADMNKLYRSMFDGTLLSDDLLEQAQTFSEQSEGSYGLGLQAVPAKCDAVPGGVAMGHTGGGLGHSTFSFHSPDGHTQASVTFATDPMLLPADSGEKVYKAVSDVVVAGLCGDEAPKVDGDSAPMLDTPLTAVKQ